MLPKISSPIFTTTIPSSGKSVNFRPLQVREEKILLIAKEEGSQDQMVLAVKQILNNCFFDIEVETLPLFDIQWLLLHLRAASVDNIINFNIVDQDTQEIIDISVPIEDIKITNNPEHTNKIKADDEYTIIMRYPSIEETFKILSVITETTKLKRLLVNEKDDNEKRNIREKLQKLLSQQTEYEIMISCLDSVVGNDQVFKFADSTPEETAQFMDSLDSKVVAKIKAFFETMPTIKHEITYKNNLGTEKTFVINGFEGFFS